ncbi:pre-60S factor rei1 [Coemansia sp. Cherry 401B]|nr:pre-60S factor rei1 [Coemansia sp. RSA 2705]KAJ2318792.1 pre-60S factor rei1 [Coemansia sp. RSA 2704]KAJ2730062.1 pre-60S factor rei1 [Coemansia sp. Cherry 401B]
MDSTPQATGGVPTNTHNLPQFTCIACQVAFYSADQQRTHYRSDWHRYNLKRKVAGLPPVTAESFAQRLLAQQAQAVEDTKRAEFSADCTVCKKAYSSENAFNNHLNSKKHREAEAQMVRKLQAEEDVRAEQAAIAESIAAAQEAQGESAAADAGATDAQGRKVVPFPVSDDEDDEAEDDAESQGAGEPMDEDRVDAAGERRRQERELRRQLVTAASEAEAAQLLEKKHAAAPRLNPDADCLFCTHTAPSFEANMEHMEHAHSLFIPDLEYLVDLRGLIKYLADKISVANVCIHCNGRGRMLHSLEAVRKHMADKRHWKIAYDSEIDILEISDFYDFSSTHPDAAEHEEDEELADGTSERTRGLGAGFLTEEDGELVLPSGNRIGHRALQRYYKQNVPAERAEKDSVMIHKMLTSYEENPEYSTQLTQASRNRAMILAQPNGYKAWKAMATFKEKRVKDNFRTRVGIRNNGLQKHYREQNPI